MKLTLSVDRDLCEANARCVRAAPEVFHVDDADTLVVLLAQFSPDSQALPKVKEAIRLCPRGALSLRAEDVEDGDTLRPVSRRND